MLQINQYNCRLDYRRSYITEISYDSDHAIGKGYTRDISLGGVFVTADHKLPPGTDVLLTLPFPNSARSVSLRGTVVRVTRHGFAVSFKRPEPTSYQEPDDYWRTPWSAA